LIDELDRTDEAFEAFLLEVLSDFQVTIPELGTVKAAEPPVVILTSNRTREIHDALKRRCLYHWVDYPDAARELAILKARVPDAPQKLSREVVAFVRRSAARTCSRRRASPRPWIGPRPWSSSTPWRSILRWCRTRWGCC
jgi:MoxR-like ATPase